jgi:hypothetical protein
LSPQGRTVLDTLKAGANQGIKFSKPALDMASLIPYAGGLISKAQPLLFNAIRNQIICVDDLERASGVSVKDVFGLISFLREQRGCKIALLLNERQFECESAKQFSNFFEKVIDAKIVFEPTPEDAANVALGKDNISRQISDHGIKLGIRNIRVIKKIERMVLMIVPHVERFGPEIIKQTIHSLTVLGWSALDTGANPPPLDYVKESSLGRLVDRRSSGTKPSIEETRWDTILHNCDWGMLDDFDLALANFVERSVIDADEIERSANAVKTRQEVMAKTGSFEKAWRVFHRSFANDDEEVCTALVEGFKNSFDVLSRRNLDEVVSVLRALGRGKSADDLIQFADDQGSKDFWTSDDPFSRAVKDSKIRSIMDGWAAKTAPVFDFEADLIRAVSNPRDDIVDKLAALPVEDYQALFESKAGDELQRIVGSALEYRKYANPSEGMKGVIKKAEEALRRIGRKSTLNELRVQVHGIVVKSSESDGNCPTDA